MMFSKNIYLAGQAITAIYDGALEPTGITWRQFMVMEAISENTGGNQRAISVATEIDRSTISIIVRALKSLKLADRIKSDDDERSYALSLTKDGKKTLTKARRIVDRTRQKTFKNFSIHDLEAADTILSGLIAMRNSTAKH
jgi:DNA-binding MarR family transcriptional regulator